MELFHNSNGSIYEVLDQYGDYTLLKDTGKSWDPYIVAFDIQEDYWRSGHYFKTLEDAKSDFIERTGIDIG